MQALKNTVMSVNQEKTKYMRAWYGAEGEEELGLDGKTLLLGIPATY